MSHCGGQCQRVLFSEGDAAFTRKPIDHQHGERVTRVQGGQYTKCTKLL